jgi:hypothetical protein
LESSPVFQICTNPQTYDQFDHGVERPPEAGDVFDYLDCAGMAIDSNRDVAIAIGIIIIAIFAGATLLVASTQSPSTESSAESIERINERQAEAIIAADSPRLFFISFKFARYDGPDGPVVEDPISGSPNGFLRPLVCVRNGGRSPMPVTKLCMDWMVTDQLPPSPEFRRASDTSYVIEQDQTIWLFDPASGFELTDDQLAQVQAGTAHLWLYGFVSHLDHLSETIENGFVMRWNSVESCLDLDGPEDYFYEKHHGAVENADLSTET